MATLIRTDRNGTKYYSDCVCRKCGGSGYLRGYEHIASGICFRCGGDGTEAPYSWKEYTEEYAQVLAERRLARERKKAPEKNARFLEQNGFSEDGMTWIVLGDTFAIKDELKENGAKYTPELGWHFSHEQGAFPCVPVSVYDLTSESGTGELWYIDSVKDKVDGIRHKAMPSTSEWRGNVGEKLTVSVTFTKVFWYDTQFGTCYVYKFTDGNGNTIAWKTAKGGMFEYGKEYTLTGTVKAHDEYKGEKQTLLTRCKVG